MLDNSGKQACGNLAELHRNTESDQAYESVCTWGGMYLLHCLCVTACFHGEALSCTLKTFQHLFKSSSLLNGTDLNKAFQLQEFTLQIK